MKRPILLLTGLLICFYASANSVFAPPARGGGNFRVLIPIFREKPPKQRASSPSVYEASDRFRRFSASGDNRAAVSRADNDTPPQKNNAFLLLAATGTFLLLAAGLFVILRQRRLVRRWREQHTRDKEQLRELAGQLAAANLRHETAVHELSTANCAKDKYLSCYIQRSTFYINKLEQHRAHLYKTALSHGHERLLRELRSPTPIEQEYKSFFHEFDRVFLSLYPDFVEKANALLRESERIKTHPGLNTEFRLLAVIRLGITGNSEIAHLLHISINTVYTYRNRLRNAAMCPPAEFEQQISKIV